MARRDDLTSHVCPTCGGTAKRWTKDRILKAAWRYEEEFGRLPSLNDWRTGNKPSWCPASATVAATFGNWTELRKALGQKTHRRVRWEPDLILEVLINEHSRLGRWPTSYEWLEATDDHPCYMTVKYHFGGWRKAISEAWKIMRSQLIEAAPIMAIAREQLAQQDMSIRTLSDRIGMDEGRVGNLLRGTQKRVTVRLADRILVALDMPEAWQVELEAVA